MPEDMKTELLQPGQGVSQLGATHAENAGLPYLGSGSEAGREALEGFRRAGMVDESNPAERGGGGEIPRIPSEQLPQGLREKYPEGLPAVMGGSEDLVEDYFKRVRLDTIQGFIAEQQGKNYPDTSQIKLPDGTSISFGEYKKIATAIQEAQAKNDRRPIEEIIREARQPAPPATMARAPEPRPTPRPADWRDALPPEQRRRLDEFEKRISGFNEQELQLVEDGIREARAKALKDGWQHKTIHEGDAEACLRAISEKLVVQDKLETLLINAGLLDHIRTVQQKQGHRDVQDTLEYLMSKLSYHDSLLENPPPDLFPPAQRLSNGDWDKTGEKLARFLRTLAGGNKLSKGD